MRRAGAARRGETSRSARWSCPSKNTRPSASAELRGAEPHRGVDVAQPARRLLDVRLADVRRRAVAAITLVALAQGRLEELAEVAPVDVVAQDAAEPGEQPPLAGEEPRLLHRGAAG